MEQINSQKEEDKKSEQTDNKASKEPYYGDLSKTHILYELCKVPKVERDAAWNIKFLEQVTEASFACGSPQVIEGPDGFPYVQLNLPEPGKSFQCYVIKHMTHDFLMERGFGVVINPGKGDPDWVFSYGDIVNHHLSGEFYTKSKDWHLTQEEVIKEKEEVLLGQPSETILPQQTRTVIREFMKRIGVPEVKLLLMHRRKPQGTLQELVFNRTPETFESTEQYTSVMKCISWFLPRHYTYVTVEESRFKEFFEPL